MKIKVMIDSAADVTLADEKEKDITISRFAITIDEKEYIDEVDISLDTFKHYLNNESKISTSQAPIGVLMEMWDKILEDYDEVIYLSISGGLSGSYQSAYAAAQDYNGKVTVLDGRFVAYPIQLAYEAMIRYVEEGKSSQEIKALIEEHEAMYAFIIPYDINHLKRGGRITPQAAALANLLKIFPILAFEDGTIDAHDKVRTHKKALSKAVKELVEKYPNPEEYHWYILHSDLDDLVNEHKQYLEEQTGQEVIVRNLHPVILTHTGPKTFACGVLKKYE